MHVHNLSRLNPQQIISHRTTRAYTFRLTLCSISHRSGPQTSQERVPYASGLVFLDDVLDNAQMVAYFYTSGYAFYAFCVYTKFLRGSSTTLAVLNSIQPPYIATHMIKSTKLLALNQ